MVILKSAGYTDIGKIRKSNQDTFFASDEKQLYIVADGMGGHKAGDVASRMTVAAVENYFKTYGKQKRNTPVSQMLQNSIQFSNRTVFDRAITDDSCSGMGSTVSIVFFTGPLIAAANVGDSPIYMIRNKTIKLLSTPHTLLYEQAAAKKNFVLPKNMKLGHILTRAIGIKETVEPDVCEFPYLANDIFIICSDGLSGKVSRNEILDITLDMEPEKACLHLTDLANQRGGEDNITTVIIKVTAVETEHETGKNNMFKKLRNFFGTPT